MKKSLIFLSLLILPEITMANNEPTFTATDKILHFDANVLISVITKTFPEKIRLDVANKYTELMDKNGNVSTAGLVQVCRIGQLTNVQCKDFIRSLLNTDPTVEQFYWADFIKVQDKRNPQETDEMNSVKQRGYAQNGKWWIIPGWLEKSKTFANAYPGVDRITGTIACTKESGKHLIADPTKNFENNEKSGHQCWCKMTHPAESAWVYYAATKDAETCSNQCAYYCNLEMGYNYADAKSRDGQTKTIDYVYHSEHYGDIKDVGIKMRQAMFTNLIAVKTTPNTTPDKTLASALNKAFKPCEFDWGKTSAPDLAGMRQIKLGWKTVYPYQSTKGHEDQYFYGANISNKSYNAEGLNNEEWMVSGFSWMKSEEFQCKYPGVTKIKGVATCVKDTPPTSGQDNVTTTKNLKPYETSGNSCWCKMTYPEESRWFHLCNGCSYAETVRKCAQNVLFHFDNGYYRPDDRTIFQILGKK